jgi:hypothetical protein
MASTRLAALPQGARMSDQITITLAGQPFKIAPLQLGQLRSLAVLQRRAYSDDPGTAEGEAFDSMVGKIVAALSRTHPEMTAEKIFAMEITFGELIAANKTILESSGLIVSKDTPSGEAQAGATPT